jgi:hypothetical protein
MEIKDYKDQGDKGFQLFDDDKLLMTFFWWNDDSDEFVKFKHVMEVLPKRLEEMGYERDPKLVEKLKSKYG